MKKKTEGIGSVAILRNSKFSLRNAALYVMVIPGLLIMLLFKYVPMYGVLMSFQNYYPNKGIIGSSWVGFKHFIDFFNSPYFGRVFGNTFAIGILSIIISFPAPIILALLINEIRNERFKRITQTISYMPYFISVVIVVGLMKELTSVNSGIINDIIAAFGFDRINFFSEAKWFRSLYIISGIWQGIGYGSIIYLSAITGINPELYESAVLDGASRFKQAIYITLPSIAPTVVVMFIFAVGGILGNDYQKILLMYSPLTYEKADVILTYVYREGILGGSFSYSTAVNTFTSVVSLFFLLLTNYLSKKFSEHSLF